MKVFVEVKGTSVYYETHGDQGSRVLLLHGWGCDASFFSSLTEALTPSHQILAIDFPGFGRSGRPPEPWGVPEYAACLKECLERLSFSPCAAVGHSFGCRVLAWSASEWPTLFTKLVFTGAAGLRKEPSEEAKRRTAAYQKKKQFLRGLEKLPGLRGLGEKMENALREKYGSADYNALDEEMRKTFVKVVNLDLRDRYPRIGQSTLLIWGDEDTETPLWMGQEMEKLIPDAGLVILEGGSHFAYMEQTGRFNTIVHHYLSEA
ncbi:MAG: alpha/beta hydrolase [Clostridia bacterium]|nr:alpha/beta hydrolase [Clostridia bacterium]